MFPRKHFSEMLLQFYNKPMRYIKFDRDFPAASLPTLVGEDKAGSVAFPVDACYNIDMEYQRDEHQSI